MEVLRMCQQYDSEYLRKSAGKFEFDKIFEFGN
jgi:hypothetical protein